MENTENTVEQEVIKTEEPTAEVEAPQEQAPQTKEEQLNTLISKRMGAFDVQISYADLKYIRNSLNGKVEWSGPNEAYLVVISILSLDSLLKDLDQKKPNEPVKLPINSSVIESIHYFLKKVKGTGLDSAQRLFGITMLFRQQLEQIKKLDSEIQLLQNELEIKSQKESQ